MIVHCVTQKGRATRRPRTTRPTRCTQSRGLRPDDRRAAGQQRPDPGRRCSPTRWCARRAERDDVVAITAAMCEPDRPRRVRATRYPDRVLRRRHRRAARADLRRRAGHRRAAPGRGGVRDVPQPGLRPGADGRRAAPAAGHVRPRPGRRHRRGRRRATTACGTCRSSAWCPACGSPRRGTRRRCATSCARRSRSPTGRPWCASPRPRSGPTCRRCAAPAGSTCWPSRRRRRRRRAAGRGRRARRRGARGGAARCAGRDTVRVVDPRWVPPVDRELITLAERAALVVTVEDGVVTGGVGVKSEASRRPGRCDPRDRHPRWVPRPRQGAKLRLRIARNSPGHGAAESSGGPPPSAPEMSRTPPERHHFRIRSRRRGKRGRQCRRAQLDLPRASPVKSQRCRDCRSCRGSRRGPGESVGPPWRRAGSVAAPCASRRAPRPAAPAAGQPVLGRRVAFALGAGRRCRVGADAPGTAGPRPASRRASSMRPTTGKLNGGAGPGRRAAGPTPRGLPARPAPPPLIAASGRTRPGATSGSAAYRVPGLHQRADESELLRGRVPGGLPTCAATGRRAIRRAGRAR